ncbi:hypothetical protein OKW18_000878 [Streptomyces pratensis]|nr:hypothetical protein [Streptomyces pratensis]
MSTDISEHPPIYSRLVEERGDILSETRDAAEQVLRQAREAVDWNRARPVQPQSGKPAPFSAFG